MRRSVAWIVILSSLATRAIADPACARRVEVRLAPVKNVQMAVWIEDASGAVVDTLYVTRSTGALGLGNRPGHPRMKGDYRFPYGARPMVLPVWAYARKRDYPLVTMGGAPGFDDNDTIGYHFPISSPESFYCSPSGGVHRDLQGVDTVSCASPFYGAKGRYRVGARSVYPPRSDLTEFTDHDSDDARLFSGDNDLAVVSGATPPGGKEIAPRLTWMAPAGLPDGSYAVRVEVSLESDFNAAWVACGDDTPGCMHPSFTDVHEELRAYGRHLFGQPSLVWSVPIVVDGNPRVATADGFQGYGAWDGGQGALSPPDATISTTVDGSGLRRLSAVSDGDGSWRVKVSTSGCSGALCTAPAPPTGIVLTPSDASIAVRFDAPTGAVRPARYEVRYRVGSALTNEGFATATPGEMPPEPGAAGAPQEFTLGGLHPDHLVSLGIRAVAACGAPSATVFASTRTRAAEFTTLHGCFIATAAYGSPLAAEVVQLRAFRDQHLLGHPLGRLAVAGYYALSPPLANAIAGDARLRAAARAVLAPLAALCRRYPCRR